MGPIQDSFRMPLHAHAESVRFFFFDGFNDSRPGAARDRQSFARGLDGLVVGTIDGNGPSIRDFSEFASLFQNHIVKNRVVRRMGFSLRMIGGDVLHQITPAENI